MSEPGPPPYVLTREGERWVFRPSALHATLMVTGFALGSAFCLYIAVVVLQKAGDLLGVGFGVLFLIGAAVVAGLAVWAWRTRRTPLTVERMGRVCYGDRELCSAGSVRSVMIAPSRGGDAGDCEVILELHGGARVSFPSQYFAGFGTKSQARPFAESLAGILGVAVTESAS
jgi:hypothetical protein